MAKLQTQLLLQKEISKRENYLEGIGSDKVFGKLTTHDRSIKEDLLPIALITDKTRALTDIAKDTVIDLSMIELDESAMITKLRRRQNSMKL
jgi:predicted homoserine dehydrogenase-like protein